MNRDLVIYSLAACPYAQRTRTLLGLKGIAHELVEIDITKPRPDWFLKINPTGQVPALLHHGRPLNELSVINEYLEECFPEPPVFPADPYARALSRIMIDFCNGRFAGNLYRLLMEQDPAKRQRIEASAAKDWAWIDAFIARIAPAGDFLFGDFGMVELTFGPFFQRYQLNEYYWQFCVPDELTRVRRWRAAMDAHPALQATSFPPEDLIKLYADYALGFANGAVPPGRERSALDPAVPLAGRPLPPPRIPVPAA